VRRATEIIQRTTEVITVNETSVQVCFRLCEVTRERSMYNSQYSISEAHRNLRIVDKINDIGHEGN